MLFLNDTGNVMFAVLTSTSVGDMFIWMPKEHLYVLVYLVTVMHSMQGGYMDKAQKYTDKALMQIEKLKSKEKLYFLNYENINNFLSVQHALMQY